jgi:hypothetical protein
MRPARCGNDTAPRWRARQFCLGARFRPHLWTERRGPLGQFLLAVCAGHVHPTPRSRSGCIIKSRGGPTFHDRLATRLPDGSCSRPCCQSDGDRSPVAPLRSGDGQRQPGRLRHVDQRGWLRRQLLTQRGVRRRFVHTATQRPKQCLDRLADVRLAGDVPLLLSNPRLRGWHWHGGPGRGERHRRRSALGWRDAAGSHGPAGHRPDGGPASFLPDYRAAFTAGHGTSAGDAARQEAVQKQAQVQDPDSSAGRSALQIGKGLGERKAGQGGSANGLGPYATDGGGGPARSPQGGVQDEDPSGDHRR